jgi:hypothetical protein
MIVDLVMSILTCHDCHQSFLFVEDLGPFFGNYPTVMGNFAGKPGIFDLSSGRNNFRLQYIKRVNPKRASDILKTYDETMRKLIEGEGDDRNGGFETFWGMGGPIQT